MRLSLKLKASARGVAGVMRRPAYALLALAVALVSVAVVLWALNLPVLWYVLVEARLPALDKLQFVIGAYESLFMTVSNPQSAVILVFAAVFGVNAALLVFVLINRTKSKATGAGLGSFGLALLGGGCLACGTSLLVPLLGVFGVSLSVGVVDALGPVALLAATVFSAYGVYRLGSVSATVLASKTGRN